MQFDRKAADARIVNAGSVGVSFGEPGAYWLLLDPAPHLRYSAYDLADAAARVRATNYPQAEEFATRILNPPSAREVLEAMEGWRVRYAQRFKGLSAKQMSPSVDN